MAVGSSNYSPNLQRQSPVLVVVGALSYAFFKLLHKLKLLRVSPEVEIGGLDIPEMGVHGYFDDQMNIPGSPSPVRPSIGKFGGLPAK